MKLSSSNTMIKGAHPYSQRFAIEYIW